MFNYTFWAGFLPELTQDVTLKADNYAQAVKRLKRLLKGSK